MAALLTSTLTQNDFHNWLKGALAVLFAKEGLTDFVSTEINQCHSILMQNIRPSGNKLNKCSCTIDSLPKCTRNPQHKHTLTTHGLTSSGNVKPCSRNVCDAIMEGICQMHRFRGPSWKNSDLQKWCTDPYVVAKCYMPPDGYADKSSLAETDFNGVLAIIINNKSFQTKIQDNLSTEPNICTKARKVGRTIRHSADHLLSDSDLRSCIDDLINLLCDPANLANDPTAKIAVEKLKQLKANTLTIHESDITEVLGDNIKETFSEQHQHYIQSIVDHYSKLQTDSVAEIDRLVSIKKKELEEFTSEQKDEITRHATIKKQEIQACYDLYQRVKHEMGYDEKFTVLCPSSLFTRTLWCGHNSLVEEDPRCPSGQFSGSSGHLGRTTNVPQASWLASSHERS